MTSVVSIMFSDQCPVCPVTSVVSIMFSDQCPVCPVSAMPGHCLMCVCLPSSHHFLFSRLRTVGLSPPPPPSTCPLTTCQHLLPLAGRLDTGQPLAEPRLVCRASKTDCTARARPSLYQHYLLRCCAGCQSGPGMQVNQWRLERRVGHGGHLAPALL